MNRNRNAVDGFITPDRHRRSDVINAQPNTSREIIGNPSTSTHSTSGRPMISSAGSQPNIHTSQTPSSQVDAVRADVRHSLDAINNHSSQPKKELTPRHVKKLDKLNKRRRLKNKSPLSPKQYKRRLWVKRISWLIAVVIAAFMLFQGYRILTSLSKIVSGNVFNVLQKKKLKQDASGRTNILIFGTSPEGWDGADLADSIMVVSYHQEKNDMFTISLPRDLYVKHQCSGWLGTTAGKLNESYACGKAAVTNKQEAETAGQNALASAAYTVLGLDIHYKVHANWRVLTEVVDSIGGIDVTIEAYDGSREIYDVATKVRYKNGEKVHLNGERALALSRARGSAGGYGFSGGNFDRERNQQKILNAIISKIKASHKADFATMTNIMESLGNNINTTFEAGELQAVADLAQKYNSNNTKSIPLVDEKTNTNLLTTDTIAGGSVVVPTEGTFEYGAIRRFVKKHIAANGVVKEDAKIVVLNGTTITGLAGKHKTKLTEKEFNVIEAGTAQSQTYQTTVVYVLNQEKKATVKKLSELYHVSSTTDIPDALRSRQADIVIVLGQDSNNQE